MPNDPSDYQYFHLDCTKKAAKASDPGVQKLWLAMAEAWLHMGRLAEQSSRSASLVPSDEVLEVQSETSGLKQMLTRLIGVRAAD